jgi:hypothetical protein
MAISLPIVNLKEATFECTFGRGCDGNCCREGRPLVYANEIEIITANLHRFLPQMRPRARAVAEKQGFLAPRRRRLGERVMRAVQGWCVFFSEGCVLHRIGAAEGDKHLYKPSLCSLFPIQQDDHDRWYIRQKGFQGERWDLFCLDPCNTAVPARESLREEIALAQRFDDEQKKLGGRTPAPQSEKP